MPACTVVGRSAFHGCSSLVAVSLSVCTTIEDYAFDYCLSLTTADLPACESIGSSAFYRCSRLTNLYLTSVSSVPTLGASAFYSTPIGGYTAATGSGGLVYVPASLVDSFKTAQYWSSISSRIFAI